ncbi:MAG: DUF4292 domain-containing protein [Chitinophagales bacterium]|nr:DUF4292 domain-containing protein [Chitinophagales bacterium]
MFKKCRYHISFPGIALLLLLCASCKTPSVISKISIPPAASKKVNALQDSMNLHLQHFDWYAARVKILIKDSGDQTELTATIRIRQDSAIWISVSPGLGIEVARILITSDSIRGIDRIHQKHYSEGFDFFKKYTSQHIDLKTLQDLIEGNPLFLTDKQFIPELGDSTLQLEWTQDSLQNLILLNRQFQYLTQTILEPSSGLVVLTNGQFDTSYSPSIAMWRKIELLKPHPAVIILTFSKVKINDPQNMPFN